VTSDIGIVQRAATITLPHTELMAVMAINRSQLVQRGRSLEYFTVAYNSLEGLVSIVAGFVAGSVSLVGFGLDSLIEVTSGVALLCGCITI
jgi:divalent metal cation (Fe/Co/Zn/Cd) transporter